MRQEIDFYHGLVRDAKVTQAFYDQFQEQLRKAKITYGDRVSAPYLRPQFLSTEQYGRISQVCKLLWSALEKIQDRYFEHPEWADMLALTPAERELIAIDPKYRRFSPMARFDSFLTEDSFQFVELNAECPAGVAYTEVLAEEFLTLPMMKDFLQQYDIKPFRTREKLKEVLLATWAEWGGQGTPNVAIVDWAEVATYAEFQLVQEYFRGEGIPCEIEDPRKLVYKDGKLYTSTGYRIDLFYRRVLTNEYLERAGDCQAMLQAYKDQACCFVNPFRSKVLHKKMIFGLLTDPQIQQLFTAEEVAAINKHIPWTRAVQAGKTMHHSQGEIDLLPWMRANRNNLVIKPNDEYGGKGIHIGWEEDEPTWEAAIQEALQHPFVVQEKVNSPRYDFPAWGEGQLVFEPQMVDLDPFIFHGEVEGVLTRLSGTALCNVTAGGGIVPTFVIEKKAVPAGRA